MTPTYPRASTYAPDWAGVYPSHEVVLSTRQIVTWLCQSMVITTIVCSRLALPFGAKQITVTQVLAIIHLVCIAVFTGGAISFPRLVAIGVTFAIIAAESLIAHPFFSPLSLLYVMGVYGPLIVATRLDEEALERIWKAFISLMCVAAVLGILQLLVQLGGMKFPDPINWVPESFRLRGYSTTYPIATGVLPYLKPNGMLFVEPSILSQFLALAFVAELWLFRRRWCLILLGSALGLSFSGTGLLMVGAAMLFAAPRVLGTFLLVGALAALIVIMAGFGEAFARVNELQRPGTSGHQRFVAPYAAMAVPWYDSSHAVLWGYGAGRVELIDIPYPANYSPAPKVVLEYGLVGTAGFLLIWLAMFTRLAIPRSLVAAFFVMYFLAAGSLLQPFTVFPFWALTAGFLKRPRAAPALLG